MLTRSKRRGLLMCDTSTVINMEREELNVAEGTIAADALTNKSCSSVIETCEPIDDAIILSNTINENMEGVNTAEVTPQHVEAVVSVDIASGANESQGEDLISHNEVAEVSRPTSGGSQQTVNSSDDLLSKMFAMMQRQSQETEQLNLNIQQQGQRTEQQNQENRAMMQRQSQEICEKIKISGNEIEAKLGEKIKISNKALEEKLDRQDAKLTAQIDLANKQISLLNSQFNDLKEQTSSDVQKIREETTDNICNLKKELRTEISINSKKVCEFSETVTQTKQIAEEAKTVASSAKNVASELQTLFKQSAEKEQTSVSALIKRMDSVERTIQEKMNGVRLNNTDRSNRAEVVIEGHEANTNVTVRSDNCAPLLRASDTAFAETDSVDNSCHTVTGVVQNEVTNTVHRSELQYDTRFEVEQFLKIKRFQTYRDDGNTMHPKTWISQFDLCLPPSWPLINQLDFILGFMQGAIGDTMREFATHCQSYTEFKREFLRITWSPEKQERIKYELILSKPFSESGHRSPVTFLEEMINKNRFLDNPCTTGELLRHCCGKLPASYRQLLVGKCDVDLNSFKNTLYELEVALGTNTNSRSRGNNDLQFRNTNSRYEYSDSHQWGRSNDRQVNRQRGDADAFRNQGQNRYVRWENRGGDGRRTNTNSGGEPRRNEPNRFSNGHETFNRPYDEHGETVEIRGPNPGRSQQDWWTM